MIADKTFEQPAKREERTLREQEINWHCYFFRALTLEWGLLSSMKIYALAVITGVLLSSTLKDTAAPKSKLSASLSSTEQAVEIAPPSNDSQYSEMLARLLLAELEAMRNETDTAFQNYLEVARWSKDPKIAKIATEYAIDAKSVEGALEASKLWASLEPESLQAQIMAFTLLLNTSMEDSIPYLMRAMAIMPDGLEEHLLAIQQRLSPAEREKLTKTVLSVAKKEPHNVHAHLAAAELTAQQLDIPTASLWLNSVLKQAPASTAAIKLKAKLIRYESKQDRLALDYLKKKVKELPRDLSLRLFYANALLDNQKIQQAMPHLSILSKDPKYQNEALLLISQIEIGKQNLNQAAKLLKKSLEAQGEHDSAYYLLGHLAEQQNQVNEAIGWYRQVQDGKQHITAQLRAAMLLSGQEDYREAIDVLRDANPTTFSEQKQILLTEIDILIESKDYTEALETTNQALYALPNDLEFLYARSIVASHLEEMALAEKDLRQILELNPNHANALNALGYALSNQKDHMDEAMVYLKKALALSPKNPAFMDSMGWLLYHMGKLEDSKQYLQKAYQLSQDTEIAAHLGEVLWMMGDQQQARLVWKKALEADPEHEGILATMHRLQVKPVSPVKVVHH